MVRTSCSSQKPARTSIDRSCAVSVSTKGLCDQGGAFSSRTKQYWNGEPGSVTTLLGAESVVALAERDEATARAKAEAAIEAESGPGGVPNVRAAQVWWAGRLFGAAAAGGEEALEAARELLERHHWRQALREPDLAADLRR